MIHLGERRDQPIRPEWRKNYRSLLQLRTRLLKERGELQKEGATEIPIDEMHPAESASDEFDHSLALSLLSAEQDALYEVEEALARIRNGTYGICEVTGKRIPAERLKALPWTRFTVEARKQLEAERQVGEAHIGPARTVRERIEAAEEEIPSAVNDCPSN